MLSPLKTIELQTQKYDTLIHLLYVPSVFCNLGCHYCYLGTQTETKLKPSEETNAIKTLRFALEAFKSQGILPFNISLHGGEVTTVSKDTLSDLYDIISSHYLENLDVLTANNFKKISPHIKTNLYTFDKLYSHLVKHKVSISASIDLPLRLHDKYRTKKSGDSTLPKTLENLKLLSTYPFNAKISSTLFQEHLEYIDEIIEDIWYIHREIGFDMNQFNFMFGFKSDMNNSKLDNNGLLSLNQVTDDAQVALYETLKAAFMGTELEYGFRKNWFDEFTTSYCTSSINCGEKFYLMQANGDVFSCVRGQGVEPFKYGNIFTNTAAEILEAGKQKILTVHQQQKFHEDCQTCEYLNICHTGCPYVKNETNGGKSYTCQLQKRIYKDNPLTFPASPNQEHIALTKAEYEFTVHPKGIASQSLNKRKDFTLPNDFHEVNNRLGKIIEDDQVLKELYSNENILLEHEGDFFPLQSQILKVERKVFNFFDGDDIKLHVKKSFFAVNAKQEFMNTLHLQMLRDTPIEYGDEQRTKQEHIFTTEIYRNQLKEANSDASIQQETWIDNTYVSFDLEGLLSLHTGSYKDEVLNNLFITTKDLRNYHYDKQKNNAFYHIQAINLPFQNIEFWWSTIETP